MGTWDNTSDWELTWERQEKMLPSGGCCEEGRRMEEVMSRTILKWERVFENCLVETSRETAVILSHQDVGGTIAECVCVK